MRKVFLAVTLFCIFFTLSRDAEAYVVDGLVSDWGISPGIWNSSSSTNNSDWIPSGGVRYTLEDQTGGTSTYVGPGYGGQKYDAEAMYFDIVGDYAYFAIVTGFPEAGRDKYIAGDIALDIGSDGTYEYGIKTAGAGKGSVYKDVTWLDAVHYHAADPSNIDTANSTLLGLTDLVYAKGARAHSSYDWWHYIIEWRLPLSFWGEHNLQHGYTVHWTISCGNDELNLVITPEPSSLMLLLFGITGLGILKRKKVTAES